MFLKKKKTEKGVMHLDLEVRFRARLGENCFVSCPP